MQYFKVSGTHYEMGLAHGKQYREAIRKSFETHCKFDAAQEMLDAICADIEKKLEAGMPYAAEELRGMAEGSGLTYRQAIYLNNWEEIAHILTRVDPQACSSIIFKHTEMGNIIGKNTDIEEEQLKDYFILETIPENGNHCLMLAKVGTLKCEAGMNDKGLCVGVNSSVQFADETGMAERMTVMRYLLEKCETAEEAAEFLKSHPFYRLGLNMAIIDEGGRCLIAECGNTDMDTIPVEKNTGFTTNHYTTEKMKPLYDEAIFYRDGSHKRYDTLTALLADETKTCDIAFMKRLLTCFPPEGVRGISGASETRYSTIWAPKERRVLVCECFSPEPVFASMEMCKDE